MHHDVSFQLAIYYTSPRFLASPAVPLGKRQFNRLPHAMTPASPNSRPVFHPPHRPASPIPRLGDSGSGPEDGSISFSASAAEVKGKEKKEK